VLELDFLKRRYQTSDCYHQMRCLGSNATEMRLRPAPYPLTGFEGAASTAYAYKSAGLL